MTHRRISMAGLARIAGALALVSVPGLLAARPAAAQAAAQPAEQVTRETVERWMVELSNRGRWGEDDERGTLNLITPDAVVRAAALARSGITVSLAHEFVKEPAPDAGSVFEHEMIGEVGQGPWASDRYSVAYHGHIHAHMDAPCHNSYEGEHYSGFARAEVVGEDGVQADESTASRAATSTK